MLEVTEITKKYKMYYGIKNISLQIPEGQIIGLFGENGAEKTTLLKVMAGLLGIDFGEVILKDEDIISINRNITFISETYSFFPWYTAKKNGVVFSELFPQFDLNKFQKLIKIFDLPDDTGARSLSRGNKSKLEMALGFSKGGKYILLDEPFLGNDMFTRKDFLKLICSTLDEKQTIIIATHLIEEVELLLDRIIILRNGYLLRDELMDNIRERTTLGDIIKQDYEYSDEKFRELMNINSRVQE